MKLRDIYRTTRSVFSFEFFPPKSERAEQDLFATVDALKALNPAFFSMTYGAGGSTREKTVTLADAVRRAGGIETVCHLTCVGQSRTDIAAVIEEIRSLGMENVMALRGDPPRGQTDWTPHPDGFRYASELVEEIRRHGDFSIAVAGFPEVHPDSKNRDDDLRFLKLKIDKGADVVVTQLFFRNEDYFAFVRDLRALGVTIPIVPGVMPILSLDQVRRFCATCGAALPAEIERELEKRDGDPAATEAYCVRLAADQIRELLAGGVPGVHLYCLNRSALALQIFSALGIA
jgi:methylenetetrahydrofolate reductase (NADPH)